MTTDRLPRPLDERVSFLLSQLGHRSAETLDAALRPLHIHPRQFGMLVHLARAEGASQQELAAALGVHRNVMVGLVDDLEGRGLVERRRHPEDRRAHAVHLTAHGRRVLTRAERLADQHDVDLCHPLGTADHESLRLLLDRLVEGTPGRRGVHDGLRR